MTIGKKVLVTVIGRSIESVDNYKFYFHFFGYYAFYVNACRLPHLYVGLRLRKTCEIRCKFNENSVLFYAAYYSRNGLTLNEKVGVFLPSAEQLFMRKRDFIIGIYTFDYNLYIIAYKKIYLWGELYAIPKSRR